MVKENLSVGYRLAAAIAVLVALLFVPAPLLPPHRLAEATQLMLGLGWKVAYLAATIGIEIVFYGSIGILTAFIVKRGNTWQSRLFQTLVVPLVVIGLAMIIRSLKVGHLPVWINAAIPVAACLLGVWLGLSLIYRRWLVILILIAIVAGVAFWGLRGGTTATLTQATENHLQRLIAASSTIPAGEGRFGELLRTAFASPTEKSGKLDAVQSNRAAILALGIALGDERLANFVGLDRDSKLVRDAALLRKGTRLRTRSDWARHFSLSAALAVLEHPLISDAGGLMKEQMDALTGGSGFSFCDFAADRAGVRFAEVATTSEKDALAMQDFLRKEFTVSYILPEIADLPENLTTEQFRANYGAVGSDRYRETISEIETRLDKCVALSSLNR
jgi:hypothetical protein